MSRIFRIPKIQVFLTLLLIFASSFSSFNPLQSITVLIQAILFMAGFDLFFTYIIKRTFFAPYAALVTGTIIALLINPASAWYEIMLATALASFSKNFIRPGRKHIFNPAAFGLFVSSLIVGKSLILWWGAPHQVLEPFSVQNAISFFILFLPLYVSGFKMRRWFTMISFFLLYTILSLVMGASFQTILDPVIIFFIIVMLPEPMTSPIKKKRQLLFGLFVAILVQVLAVPSVNGTISQVVLIPDPLLLALLVGNLLFFKLK